MALAWPAIKELSQLRERINDLVDNACLEGGPGAGEPSSGPFCPTTDLYETADHVVVIMEVPGADPPSIDLQVNGDRLRVSGRLSRSRENHGGRFVRMERADGAFYRDFTLPVAVSTDDPVAELEHGVLTVRLAKAPHARRRKIPIQEDVS
jgi:HSP20 family protein